MFQFNKLPGQRILELGGGANRHHQTDVNVDVRPGPGVDFTADFDKPLPIKDNDFDGVVSIYCIEHLSWRNVLQFLKETLRVLKPLGSLVLVTANTESQIHFIKENPDGWDGKDAFESFSCLLFGDQDYPENTHKNYMTPDLITGLLVKAGFIDVLTQPYGSRSTDMLVVAKRPEEQISQITVVQEEKPANVPHPALSETNKEVKNTPPEELFDKHYFHGGTKVGGYANEGYRDFPVHEITFRHLMRCNPASVLELGCARGHILKRFQDAGIPGIGLEVSRHCWMTRVTNQVIQQNLCSLDWISDLTRSWDLCYSMAVLEHIPEEHVPALIKNMAAVCKRGLHGVDFGTNDDGFDKTHCTLRPKEWWEEMFAKHAPGWPVEIVSKDSLEQGEFPASVLKCKWGHTKVNVGCYVNMFHHGWINVDILDLTQYAAQNAYHFRQMDCRNGLSFETESVDAIYSSHFLEHLSYEEGLNFLKDCRRVIKPTGKIRLAVPNLRAFTNRISQCDEWWADLSHIGDVEKLETHAAKMWAFIFDNHRAAYDAETLRLAFSKAGFEAGTVSFGKSLSSDDYIIKETFDPIESISLIVEATPR